LFPPILFYSALIFVLHPSEIHHFFPIHHFSAFGYVEDHDGETWDLLIAIDLRRLILDSQAFTDQHVVDREGKGWSAVQALAHQPPDLVGPPHPPREA
jgi:hypothetical protein